MKAGQPLRIGVFDSGIGGLTVLSEAMHRMPKAGFLYYADTAHVPYGERSQDEVLRYVQEAAVFLIERAAVDALVVACNTATSAAAAPLRQQYALPIIGMEPAVKPALTLFHPSDRDRVIVTATDMTLKLEKLSSLLQALDAENQVERLSLQKLVRFAEAGDFCSREVRQYVVGQFALYDLSQVHSVVLGCTHFSFFKPLLKEVLPEHITLIDGNVGTVSRLCSFFPTQCSQKTDTINVEAVHFYDAGQAITGDALQRIQDLLRQASHKDGPECPPKG